MQILIDDETWRGENPPVKTVPRFAALLCRYELHKWMLWQKADAANLFGEQNFQERRCNVCGKREQIAVSVSPFFKKNK